MIRCGSPLGNVEGLILVADRIAGPWSRNVTHQVYCPVE